MTWNIRTGGQDRGGPDRRDRLARVVAEQRPDVLATHLHPYSGTRRLVEAGWAATRAVARLLATGLVDLSPPASAG
ncbi:hypothetical protein [Micromonospora tarapacensis]|uniref:hypothetical protein n=1 Tax=Micromonospora tarapacensis TaxID=2835305 RepID=UPI001E4C5B3D|nr:hypothetical protein [Micromonospora tarapacensis]